jgi:hypothetical protein
MTGRRIFFLCGLTALLLCPALAQLAPNAEGKASVNKLLQALGGPAKVTAVRTLRQRVIMVRQGQQIEIDQSIVYPDKQAQKISLPEGQLLQVVTPTVAFMAMGTQVRDLPPSQVASLTAALKHDFINVLQHVDNPKYTFSAMGKEKVEDAEAAMVDVNANGVQTRWWIGTDGKILQERYSIVDQAGVTTQTMKYSDWKSFDGLEYPTKYEMFGERGSPRLSMTLVAMEVNAVVDPRLFEKPPK